jgi:hypothetical protein
MPPKVDESLLKSAKPFLSILAESVLYIVGKGFP